VWADEPTGDLDSENAEEIVALMRRLNREQGLTFLNADQRERPSVCALWPVSPNEGQASEQLGGESSVLSVSSRRLGGGAAGDDRARGRLRLERPQHIDGDVGQHGGGLQDADARTRPVDGQVLPPL